MIETLRDRRVIVTGAASGIGLAVAERFAAAGAVVGINHLPEDPRGPQEVERLSLEGARVDSVPADVRDRSQLTTAVAAFADARGSAEIAIANAGIAQHVSFVDQGADDWDRMIGIHLFGARNLVASTLPPMLEAGFGRIIFTVSELALSGAATLTHYCAAKGGMIAFAKALAREVGPRGVTVNCVAPGPTETEMLTTYKDEYTDENRLALPLQRWGDPSEIAWTYAHLASDAGSWFTGQVLSPNGGAVM